MSRRFSNVGVLVPVVVCFGIAGGIALLVYLSGPAAVLDDVDSVVRMPVPGDRDVGMSVGGYGLYFGDLNAPRGKVMGVPSLDVTIVPPDGVADPEFVNVKPGVDVYVEGFHTVQVARIGVARAGVYHVHVESREENGGSFSIGELPRVIGAGRNVLRGWPFVGGFGVVGVGFLVRGVWGKR